ncbi:MAG: hypothetical protein J6D08_11545 [Lachnospiraceae bacterium]|nr:hypothetical protein [Lachnospiraceae bacterium]
MLVADKKDYRRGYKKHYQLYKRLRGENSDVNSRRLLLVYSVECGLKYMLLDKWNEENPKNILNSNDDRKKDILKSHNLDKMLKELGQQGNFKFPQLETAHKNLVVSETYHQLYRYCIRTQEKQQDKEEKLEESLNNVACWIEEGM